MDLNKIKKVHLIGIGGIGVSALARLFLNDIKIVTGSDVSESKVTKGLVDLGVEVFIGHRAENLTHGVDLVVYTPAVNENNPEIVEANKLGVPILSYPQALGLISMDYSLIAVSGTHGKTTTTAMSAKVLVEANFDPSVVIGSLLKKTQTNYIAGKSEYLIIEACEYKRSFLNFKPHILIITNIDLDHLDYYKDLADIQSAFIELVSQMLPDDYLICDVQHKNLEPIVNLAKCQMVNFKTFSKDDLNLKIPGEHNLENAQCVLALAEVLKIDKQQVIKSLNNFEGTWRRSEYRGKTLTGVKIYDDYAHNPTEVNATLKGFRDFFPKDKITVIFQPHLYSRTKTFLREFAQSFDSVDRIIILPIYAARESFDFSINSEMLAEEIKKYKQEVFFAKDFTSAVFEIKKNTDIGIIITMGAGDVHQVGESFLENKEY